MSSGLLAKLNLKISSVEDHVFLFLSKWIIGQIKYISKGHILPKSHLRPWSQSKSFPTKTVLGFLKKTIRESQGLSQ